MAGMRRSLSLAFLLGLAAVVSAQDSAGVTQPASAYSTVSSASPTGSSNTDGSPSTSSSEAVTHTVAVAKGGHTFVPDVTQAQVGDTILFQFYPTNHSVIRAEYGFPCIPYEDTGVDKVGFFSGFWPVDVILSDPPTWSLLINDTDPIFFYCGAPGSCINFQMVGVINPNASTSLVTQKRLAKDSSFMLLPGDPWPDEGSANPFSTSSSPSPTAGGTSSTSSSNPASGGALGSSSSSSSSSHHSSLSSGAIAGIAIGASAVALAAAVLLYLCGRQSRRHHHQPLNKTDDRPDTAHGTVASSIHHASFNPHMSYLDHHPSSKHMSMHSSVMVPAPGPAPALPGYVPQHDPAMSPPLPPSAFPATTPDAYVVNHGGGGDMSTSPSQMFVAPAYTSGIPPSIHSTTPHQSIMYTHANSNANLNLSAPPPPNNIHEMAASEPLPPLPPAQGQGPPTSGIMGFIRRSSMSKNHGGGGGGGVERYG